MGNQKGFAPIIILVGILILAGIAGGGYYLKVKTPSQRACTLEAKICPDGSSVGRKGPRCEFADCPSQKNEGCDALIGQQDGRDFVKGELLIGFNDNVSLNEAQGVIQGLGLMVIDDRAFANLKVLGVKVAEGEEFKWICVLRKNQQIKYAEINQKIQIPDCSKGPC